VKLVINGAGAAAIACAELVKAMGMRPQNVICATPRASSTAAAPRA
jgi:malate dehydrogenase (oxaloacetate-decarboxylating)(NADP+)